MSLWPLFDYHSAGTSSKLVPTINLESLELLTSGRGNGQIRNALLAVAMIVQFDTVACRSTKLSMIDSRDQGPSTKAARNAGTGAIGADKNVILARRVMRESCIASLSLGDEQKRLDEAESNWILKYTEKTRPESEEKDKAEAAKQEMDAITKAQVSVNSKIAECSKGFLLR